MVASHLFRNTSTLSDNSKVELPLLKIKNILMAEDDDDDFNLFNAALLSLYSSVNVLRTENGIMLTSLLETSLKPDVIFLDINLPFKSGFICLQEIRNNVATSDIKVVMYSTSNNEADVYKSYQLGANFYLVKPYTYPMIVRQFHHLFTNRYFITNTRPPIDNFLINYC